MARRDFPLENSNFLAVASYMVYKVMVDWIKVLKVCVSKRHSLKIKPCYLHQEACPLRLLLCVVGTEPAPPLANLGESRHGVLPSQLQRLLAQGRALLLLHPQSLHRGRGDWLYMTRRYCKEQGDKSKEQGARSKEIRARSKEIRARSKNIAKTA